MFSLVKDLYVTNIWLKNLENVLPYSAKQMSTGQELGQPHSKWGLNQCTSFQINPNQSYNVKQ